MNRKMIVNFVVIILASVMLAFASTFYFKGDCGPGRGVTLIAWYVMGGGLGVFSLLLYSRATLREYFYLLGLYLFTAILSVFCTLLLLDCGWQWYSLVGLLVSTTGGVFILQYHDKRKKT